MRKIFGILIFLLSTELLSGQEIITNFLNQPGDKSSYPSGFVKFNQKIFFTANTENFGNEIWAIDELENEPYLLKDINPGKNNGIPELLSESSVILNNTLYFIANDGDTNGEIWKTDGTVDGTEKLTDFLNSSVEKLTLVDDNFYFLIKESDSLQVWISDGSKVGTKLVKEDLPIWNNPTFQGKYNDIFIFTFQPFGSNASMVWCSNGTSEGTYPITDEIDGHGAGPGGTSALTQYIEYNGYLYFVSRNYLHITDGTFENTNQVTSFHRGADRLITYADVVEINGKLYFSFYEFDLNRLFIWESDGTEAGNQKIYDESGEHAFMTSNLLGRDENLIFCGLNESGGTSLNVIDLTNYSVKELMELEDNPENISPFFDTHLCKMQFLPDGKVFSSVPTDYKKSIGWISDLDTESTKKIESLNDVEYIFNADSSFYFSRPTDLEGFELWRSDGSEDNTYLLSNINKSKYGLSNYFGLGNVELVSLNSNLIFNADDGIVGNELWKYDGTTTLLKDVRKDSLGSFPRNLTTLNNYTFFVSYDETHGSELWKTDGSDTGTEILVDINEGTDTSRPNFLTVHNNFLYLIAQKNDTYFLCKTDGVDFEFVKDLGRNENGVALNGQEMISSGDQLYFVTSDNELWISDGTESGSYELKDFYSCNNLTDIDGHLFFTASEISNKEEELWTIDGATITLVKDIGIGYSSKPADLFNYSGSLVFTAYTKENGRELWISDGTEIGTKQLIDLNPGSSNSLTDANFSTLNEILYFSANNGESGFELWSTDGSEEGTLLVKDINPGSESSFPIEPTLINNQIYFQAYDAEHGYELWKSNGIESGTLLVADIFPGVYSSCPTDIIFIENDLYFTAESVDKGRQIWKISNIISPVEYYEDYQLNVFPNPTTDFLSFNFSIPNYISISIFNSSGQLSGIYKIRNGNIDISNLPLGLYYINIYTDEKIISEKIIKK